MPSLAKQRSVIGGSNRRAVSAAERTPPVRSPFLGPRGNVLAPDLHPSESTDTISTNLTEPRRRAPRDLPRSASRDTIQMDKERWLMESKRPASVIPEMNKKREAQAAADANDTFTSRTTLSGHQEYALQIMTDFFSTRPLEQMRNAFRDADKDNSGQLELAEFQLAVRNMGSKLTDKDAKTLFKIADMDGSGTLGIDEFFINFRHDQWPRERFFWAKNCGGDANLTKEDRRKLNATMNVDQQVRGVGGRRRRDGGTRGGVGRAPCCGAQPCGLWHSPCGHPYDTHALRGML